jgi:peptide/nickel transport system permease protein
VTTFLVRRGGQALFTYACVVTLVFLLINVVGNPAALILPDTATQEEVDRLSEQLGLDRPLWVRYAEYMGNLLTGDLGVSKWTNLPVADTLAVYFPRTMLLALVTIALSLLFGLGLGILAALRQGSAADRVITALTYLCVSLPEFWLGLLLITVFAVQLGVLPTSGYGGAEYFVLPVLTLLFRPAGRIAETTRASLREQLDREYVFTGVAKGLTRSRVVVRHALRNAMLGVITLAGDSFATLVAGAVAVEVVFGWPGIGFLTIEAIERRDPELFVGIVVVVSAFVLVLNALIDVLYRVLDPRIQAR